MAVSEPGIDWVERAAIGASFACLVHCLALPLAIAAAPALASAVPIPGGFHLWILGLAVPMALVALLQGRARHGSGWPLALGIGGLGLIAAGTLIWGESPVETPVTVAGSIALATAHIANWRKRRNCAC